MKICPKCGRDLPLTDFWKDRRRIDGIACYCKVCARKETIKHLPKYEHKRKDYTKKFYNNNKEEITALSREKWRQDRLTCLEHYGGVCACCGENRYEFLAIDHINGGGNRHRSETGGKIVRWLLKNNLPKGFRVLCHNCNHSLGMHGFCPHNKHE